MVKRTRCWLRRSMAVGFLDNRRMTMVGEDDAPEMRPLFAFNNEGIKYYDAPTIVAGPPLVDDAYQQFPLARGAAVRHTRRVQAADVQAFHDPAGVKEAGGENFINEHVHRGDIAVHRLELNLSSM